MKTDREREVIFPVSCTHLIWTAVPRGNACFLWPPGRIDRDWEIRRGIPRAEHFPSDAFMRMSPDHPRNVALLDSVMNLADHVVVSAKLKEFLAAKSLKNVEFLPIIILNHKGRVASKDYFILHPIHPQNCIDIDKSGVQYSHIIRTDISFVDNLTLDPSRIDPELKIFRLLHFGSPIIVERSLAEEILAAGFRGLTFIELEEYGK